ncbi:ATP-binding protein [Seleniivibrio sp.]|uniref:hybrid sensor histidine kinase/response regulator n=1 Tax=Seleniivibrio sp. TaxID=2898801 RepID=UPI0025F404A3|nr:ATP-binding protein [Seleniivibrio sp.]MCD8554518.1 ATP-binding protein [Seleniivibrio sp.]
MEYQDMESIRNSMIDGRIVEKLMSENSLLRSEVRVSHEAAEITTRLVIEQFEKAESLMQKFESASGFLKAVMDAAMQISIIATDLDGQIILFNRGAEFMLGYTEKEARQMSFFDIFDNKDLLNNCVTLMANTETLMSDREKHAEVISQISSQINEGVFCRRNGSRFPVSFAITPIKENGNIVGCLSVAMDISTLKHAENELQRAYKEISEANERLQKLDKLKSDFLSSVSHELRTPLTSIRGFSKLIGKDFERYFVPLTGENPALAAKSEKIKENLSIILSETERLTRLINDVLDLSKIESQKTHWREEAVNMSEMLRHAVNAAKGQFDDKPEIELITDIPEALPYVFGDYDRFVQVTVNLLNNASKFTKKGSVTVHAFETGSGFVQVDVTDTGCGFPQEEAEAVFDKFRQVCHGDTLEEKPTGTGLGLSISHEIITRFGGKIWARSALNQGSTFSFTLPAMVQETGMAETTENADGKLILVVDDEMAIRSLLTQFFTSYGFRVATADNGKTAIDMAKKFDPDLITMDIAMPVMDGKTAIDYMKQDEKLKDIPIVVLSAFNDSFAANGDVVFDKPLNEQRLIDSVFMLINKEKLKDCHACLIICRQDCERSVEIPSISPKNAEMCQPHDLTAKLENGYKGLVVIPADMMDYVDLQRISTYESIQLLILPHKQ